MKKISLAYFGTPDFSASLLEKIILDTEVPLEVKLVVTQPDRPFGRKKIMTATPVKETARKYNIPTWDGVRNSDIEQLIRNLGIDLVLLFAYGKIIKKDLLEAPKYGFWNIHPSLLPKYRGTSPMTYPLILGDEVTGVTLMKMDEQMDHGQIISQEELKIDPHDKNPDLQQKSIDVAFKLFRNKIEILADNNNIIMNEQDHSQATFTRFQTKDDGFISWNIIQKATNNEELSNEELPRVIKDYLEKNPNSNFQFPNKNSSQIIYNLFRGLYPWPGIWTILPNNKRMKITDVELKENTLVLKKVQFEGKQETLFQNLKSLI